MPPEPETFASLETLASLVPDRHSGHTEGKGLPEPELEKRNESRPLS